MIGLVLSVFLNQLLFIKDFLNFNPDLLEALSETVLMFLLNLKFLQVLFLFLSQSLNLVQILLLAHLALLFLSQTFGLFIG